MSHEEFITRMKRNPFHCTHCQMQLLRSFGVMTLGLFVMGLGLYGLFFYFDGHPEVTAWTGHAMMASPTALGFSLTGLALVILGYDKWSTL